MNERDFERLVESIKQAGGIRRRLLKSGQVTQLPPPNIRSVQPQPAAPAVTNILAPPECNSHKARHP